MYLTCYVTQLKNLNIYFCIWFNSMSLFYYCFLFCFRLMFLSIWDYILFITNVSFPFSLFCFTAERFFYLSLNVNIFKLENNIFFGVQASFCMKYKFISFYVKKINLKEYFIAINCYGT